MKSASWQIQSVTQKCRLPDNSAQYPALNFQDASGSGVFHAGNGTIAVAVNGVDCAQVDTLGVVTANMFYGSGTLLTDIIFPNPLISNVQVANAAYAALDDTAVDVAGGYIIINGQGLDGQPLVYIGNTLATSVSAPSSTQLRVQVGAQSAGTYPVSVVRTDGIIATLPLGVTYSPSPVWSTGTMLANVSKTVAFTQILSANEASQSSITYAVADGSSLPPSVSLTGTGTLIGNIATDTINTTTYSFTIIATDSQQQDTPKSFQLPAFGAIDLTGCILYLDANSPTSYSGTGNVWYDLQNLSNANIVSAPVFASTYTTYDLGHFTLTGTQYFSGRLTNPSGWIHSVSLWVNFSSTAATQTLASVWTSGETTNTLWHFTYTSGSGWIYSFFGNNYVAPFTASTGVWYNVVWTYDGSTRKVYVNGAEVAGSGGTGGSLNIVANASYNIGRYGPTGVNLVSGKVSHAQIWNRALSSTEVYNVYAYTYNVYFNTG